jgi:hypothetical protein
MTDQDIELMRQDFNELARLRKEYGAWTDQESKAIGSKIVAAVKARDIKTLREWRQRIGADLEVERRERVARMRRQMPHTMAFIAQMREAFETEADLTAEDGSRMDSAINAAIKDGMAGGHGFVAREGGITIGTPLPGVAVEAFVECSIADMNIKGRRRGK